MPLQGNVTQLEHTAIPGLLPRTQSNVEQSALAARPRESEREREREREGEGEGEQDRDRERESERERPAGPVCRVNAGSEREVSGDPHLVKRNIPLLYGRVETRSPSLLLFS